MLKPGAAIALLVAVVFAILASADDSQRWTEAALWWASFASGTLALVLGYAIAITWTRRRKRLWG